jgi:hypothetical protein
MEGPFHAQGRRCVVSKSFNFDTNGIASWNNHLTVSKARVKM